MIGVSVLFIGKHSYLTASVSIMIVYDPKTIHIICLIVFKMYLAFIYVFFFFFFFCGEKKCLIDIYLFDSRGKGGGLMKYFYG